MLSSSASSALSRSRLFKTVPFSLFVFTIGYRSGPEFLLSIRTLAQVAMALVLGLTGLILVLIFAYTFHLDPRTACPGSRSGLASGSLTQSSMIGTASGALSQLGLPESSQSAACEYRCRLRPHLCARLHPHLAVRALRCAQADGREPEGRGGQARD